MADLNSVQGSVTLRKMRTGSTASVSLSSDKQLFQLYSSNSAGGYNYYPNWESNPVTVTVQTAAYGDNALEVTDVLWKLNGQNVLMLNQSGQPTKFDTSIVGRLVIRANVADPTILNLNSGTLTAEIALKDGSGNTYSVTKTETIRVQEMVESGYYVFITATRGYVDEHDSNPNVKLTGSCVQNGSPATGVTLKWYAGTGKTTEIQKLVDGVSIQVTPSMVNGTQLFVCRATDGNGTEVDAEGIVILDKSDPCYIKASVQQKKSGANASAIQENVTDVSVGESNDSSVVSFEVVNPDGTAYGSPQGWVVEKLHAATLQLIQEVSGQDYTMSGTTQSEYNHKNVNQMTVLDKDYSRLDTAQSPNKVVTDEVIVTATATL